MVEDLGKICIFLGMKKKWFIFILYFVLIFWIFWYLIIFFFWMIEFVFRVLYLRILEFFFWYLGLLKKVKILFLWKILFMGILIEIFDCGMNFFFCFWIDWNGMRNLFFCFFVNKFEFLWKIVEYIKL